MNWSAAMCFIAGVLFGQGAYGCQPADYDCGWTRLLIGNDYGNSPTVRDMVADGDGNLYLVGETYPRARHNVESEGLLAKYGPDGNNRWVRRLSGEGGGFTIMRAVAVDSAGNLCVGGVSDGAFEKGRARRGGGFAARFDASGNRLWAVNMPNAPLMAGVDDKGNCYVGSLSEVIKYDQRGKPLWIFQGSIGAMTVANDGSVYFTGLPGTTPQPFLAQLDAKGRILLNSPLPLGRSLGFSQLDLRNYAIARDGQGRLYLQATATGYDAQGSLRIGTYLAQLEPSGKLVWERYYGSDGYRWDSLHLAVDRKENIFLVGRKMTIPAVSQSDAFIISYRADGGLRWAKTFGTPLFDAAGRVAVDNYGNYYIVGGTEGELDGEKNPVRNPAVPFISRNRP